jgi:Protein of unknown function (DUF1214)
MDVFTNNFAMLGSRMGDGIDGRSTEALLISSGVSLCPATRHRLLNRRWWRAGRAWAWTLRLMPDGRLFFFDNPLHRYAMGDRTAGVHRSADGAFDIVIQADAPERAEDLSNWLPAPRGEFRIVLRAYVLEESLIGGEASLPEVARGVRLQGTRPG